MRTEQIDLWIGKADGARTKVPMRYNASHQRGYRFFTGPLADLPGEITESTPPTFEGRRLFDALAGYRRSIEPDGWRLLHAVARRDCWPKPDELGPWVQQLKLGIEQTKRVSGFGRADFADVGTLGEQQARFEEWMTSLAPVYAPRVPPKSGHEKDEPVVEFGPMARLGGEYLVTDKPDIERVLRRSLGGKRGKRGPPPNSVG